MIFVPFDLERWQSRWENVVRFNLSESGVHPLSIEELLTLSGGSLSDLTSMRMVYSQSNGTSELRELIAGLYPGASHDQVLVTVGSSEANFVSCWSMIEPGDKVAVLMPTYMQVWGLATNLRAEVITFHLAPERGWEPDPEEIGRAISPGTKLVVVTDPNNPTGHILSTSARDAILSRVAEVGAWLLVDEVYRGAERNGEITPSFWGTYERTIVVNGLSKAYGLPGLRIGWLVGPKEVVDATLERHDYTVIGPSPASDYLAIQALKACPAILQRTRDILNENYPVLDNWLRKFGDLFSWHAPECGAICFVRYSHQIDALSLVEKIRADQSILLVPGEHFQMPKYLRIGYGGKPSEFSAALELLEKGLDKLITD